MNTPVIEDKKEKHLEDIGHRVTSVGGEMEAQICAIDDRGRCKKHYDESDNCGKWKWVEMGGYG